MARVAVVGLCVLSHLTVARIAPSLVVFLDGRPVNAVRGLSAVMHAVVTAFVVV